MNILVGLNNDFKSQNEQDVYLSTLITVLGVERRRSRKDDPVEAEQNHNNFTYNYFLKTPRAGEVKSMQVCYKAFTAIFGITTRRLQTIKSALTAEGWYY